MKDMFTYEGYVDMNDFKSFQKSDNIAISNTAHAFDMNAKLYFHQQKDIKQALEKNNMARVLANVITWEVEGHKSSLQIEMWSPNLFKKFIEILNKYESFCKIGGYEYATSVGYLFNVNVVYDENYLNKHLLRLQKDNYYIHSIEPYKDINSLNTYNDEFINLKICYRGKKFLK